jgi:type I restriction enzyme S subunit
MARKTRTGGRPATAGVIGGGTALAVGKPATPTPVGFDWTPLSEIAQLETGHTPSRRHPEYWDGTIPWIGIKDATSNHGRTIYATNQSVTPLGIENSAARVLPAKTVCLSRTASIGFVVVMGVPMSTSQDFVNWICGPELDFRYLKYVLQLERETLLRFAHGTTHQTVYFPEVKAFHVLLPPIPEQRAIADVLGALDDKIESNRRKVSIALDLASGLVDEHPPTQRAIGDVADFHNRGRVPLSAAERREIPGPVPYYGASGIFGHVDRALFDEPLVLVGEDGSVVTDEGFPVTQYIWGPAWVNNHAHVLTGHGLSTELLYIVLRKADVRPYVTGAVQPKLNMGNLKQITVRVPHSDVLAHVDTQVAELLALVRVAEEENRALTGLRGALLPELLSGRMRVEPVRALVASGAQ